MKSLSDLYSVLMNRKVDMLKEILVTVGAYGSLFCAHQGLINPGDEVSRTKCICSCSTFNLVVFQTVDEFMSIISF